MNETELIDISREAIMLTIKIGAPVMLVGLIVGVAIALVQALTQIQEMTLVFVPKILAIFMAIFISFASIFFPKNSGVLPTIKPLMNTARIMKTR